MLRLVSLVMLLCVAWIGQTGSAATLPTNFSESTINGPAGANWTEAVGVQFEDNGRAYVWERGGKVWIKENGSNNWSLLIDISEEVGYWRDFGLLGFALDPNFRVNGHIYLMYTVDRHHLMNFGTTNYNAASSQYFAATIGRITRYTAVATNNFTSVDYNSRLILLGQSRSNGIPVLHESHGVGSLVFGTDGTLLASCGDGASYNSQDVGSASETYYSQALSNGIIRLKENIGAYRSQLVDCLNGKVLRIDPETGAGIPSNPFYEPENPGSARSRVWALGLRNPYRMTLRPGTGSHIPADANPGVLYIGDVGWVTWEDLNVCTGPGQNFGWPGFEGIEVNSGYYNANVQNQDAPNPLFPGGGCTQNFYFRDLLKQNTSVVANQPPFNNPCNAGQKIPGTIPQFLHTPPAIDWKHATTLARSWIYNGSGVATATNIGVGNSPVAGGMFPGNCSIGGTFYSGNNFPAQYSNSYFHGDLGEGWIKSFKFDANDQPVSVSNFVSAAGGIVDIATHPIDGRLYYITYSGETTTQLRRINYSPGGNLPPTAIASANTNYGPGPLTVQFTGSGSTDPEGLPLRYRWSFGDGTAISTNANPSHIFNATPGVPTPYTVSLTVTDSVAQVSTTTLLISVNNTPPTVAITSPVDGSQYSMTNSSVYNLTATVVDAEFPDGQLEYKWQTILVHNNHQHPDPIDTNHVTTTVISPVGCDGNTYYYRILLTVTDPAGLSTQEEVDLFPDCVNLPPLASFTADPNTGAAPLLVSFDAASSFDPNGDPLTFDWVFGDGTTGTGVTPTHSYSAVGDYTVILTATDPDGLTNTTTTLISVLPFVPPTITTTSLPGGIAGIAYNSTLVASGGITPYTWSIASGSLPPGLTLNPAGGAISGMPTSVGTFNFAARVSDSNIPSQSATQSLSIVVSPLPSTIGNTNDGVQLDIMGASAINAGRFQASANLTVTRIFAKVAAIAGNYKCAIYSDNAGQPSQFIRATSEVTGPGAGWQSFTLTSPVALTGGQYYWLAIWSDDANSMIYYSDTAGLIRWGAYSYGAWPDPIATTGSASVNYCIYATGPVLALPFIAGQTVDEGSLLTVTNTASVVNLSASTLNYQLMAPPAGASISSNGVITWIPLESQGPSNYTLITVVTNVGVPPLSATNSFLVTVREVNMAPVLTLPANTNIMALAGWNAQATATDQDLPANALTFSLVSGPSGLTVASNGLISWAPAQGQASSTNTVQISVTDFNAAAVNSSSLSVTNSFQLTVSPVLIVAAADTNRSYGLPNPQFTVNYSGFVDGDNPGVLTGTPEFSTAATLDSPPGNYAIQVTNLSSTKYALIFVDGTITVTPSGLTITAMATNKVYGSTIAFNGTEFAITSGSLFNADTLTNVTLASGGAEAGATVGQYAITPGAAQGVGLTHYSIVYEDGTMTVTSSGLTIRALDTNKVYSSTVTFAGTEFAITSGSLFNSDTLTNVTLVSDGTAPGAIVGAHAITPSAAQGNGLTNYDIVYVEGTLTVTALVAPVISSIEVTNGVAVILFSAVAGQQYVLECVDNLGATNWVQLLPPASASGPTMTLTNAIDFTSSRFYRVLNVGY